MPWQILQCLRYTPQSKVRTYMRLNQYRLRLQCYGKMCNRTGCSTECEPATPAESEQLKMMLSARLTFA